MLDFLAGIVCGFKNCELDSKVFIRRDGYIKYKELILKPSTPNVSSEMYRVVKGSFGDRVNAEQRIKDLKKVGFDSFIDIK